MALDVKVFSFNIHQCNLKMNFQIITNPIKRPYYIITYSILFVLNDLYIYFIFCFAITNLSQIAAIKPIFYALIKINLSWFKLVLFVSIDYDVPWWKWQFIFKSILIFDKYFFIISVYKNRQGHCVKSSYGVGYTKRFRFVTFLMIQNFNKIFKYIKIK